MRRKIISIIIVVNIVILIGIGAFVIYRQMSPKYYEITLNIDGEKITTGSITETREKSRETEVFSVSKGENYGVLLSADGKELSRAYFTIPKSMHYTIFNADGESVGGKTSAVQKMNIPISFPKNAKAKQLVVFGKDGTEKLRVNLFK